MPHKACRSFKYNNAMAQAAQPGQRALPVSLNFCGCAALQGRCLAGVGGKNIVLAQAIGSVITGSLALLTDTAHAITDASGLLVALIIEPDANGCYGVASCYPISQKKIEGRREKGYVQIPKWK